MDIINFLDIIILVLTLFFAYNGFRRGFIDQTSTILGLLAALFVAVRQYVYFTQFLKPYLDLSTSLLQFISFAVIFIVVNIVIHVLGITLKKIVDAIFLQPVDRVAGFLLGIFKAGIIVYLLILILAQIPHPKVDDVLSQSFFAERIIEASPLIQSKIEEIFRP
ncbi:MAG: membrane protein required for colicin V production [Halanaerobium sp. 4-GBenrich]|uniref:Membrane protein required for colicin V production n=1 Tax=Halanaerobium congolense TaxID=54121 RepID=A0A1G6HVV7_9FIRM|nr:CvpA family protein [Halanaerobium congolense]KXS49115.1 MAG: membrane protein required for colicin V production [Halanaerobium sp. T82-1]ODS50828.1 MAG: membrane protein required for colicin V production [Halanaerobium sp. 4-GBenrich]OEG62313.1 MAG: colicin V production protein [Halanaerobium sp. MDAL1]PUU92430.1 MAG: membrane protein required for colicin V production [Halanaerobium sp.]TDP27034.1 membrane protein required for colicin V production [Halanaerobium congolense]